MKRGKGIVVVLFILLMIAGCGRRSSNQVTLRFGTLSVLQALEVFVAEDMGYFEQAGVHVELVNFNTASEKDIALTGNQVDGYFGDLFTPIVLEGNGVDVSIVATNFRTEPERRMFAILGKPGGNYRAVSDLANVPVAISSNSVIHFVTEQLIAAGGVAPSDFETLESKNIGIRMQLLMSGQVEVATLPEPLVSAALAGGATLLADDCHISESQTVLVFRQEFLEDHPQAVRNFLAAVHRAGEYIAENPDSVRTVMINNVRLPEPMRETYPVPQFPSLGTPSPDEITIAQEWLIRQEVLSELHEYEDLVNGSFLP